MMQNQNRLIHGTWFLAALAAFSLGLLFNSSSSTASRPDAAGAPGARSSSPPANQGETSASASRARPGREATGQAGSPIAGLFLNTSATGISALARQALRDPNQITRRLAFSRLLEAMTPGNSEQIRAQLVELGAEADQWRDFNYSWGAIAGKAAFQNPNNTKARDLADTLAGWAAAKPNEALAMFENLPANLEGQRGELTRGLVSGLADSNRALATDLVLRLSQQGAKDAPGLMDVVANEFLRADGPEAASLWSDSLPDGPLKGAAMSRIAADFARRNPEAAAAWAQRHAAEEYATRTIERISGQWTAQDPKAAVGWLESLPAGNGQTAGLLTAFNDWEDRDPVAAGQYLLSMPNSPLRDTSISGFSNGYAWQDPQMAIQWASTISDSNLRQQTLTHAARIYYSQNPEAARTWLDSSELPSEVRQQILTPAAR
jgi:hypothetical protein